jgi:REP element-mobilizing transposase RayT
VPHLTRESIRRPTPVHVTVRVVPAVASLRRMRLAPALRRAFVGGCQKAGFRLCQFSILGNHIHLICEADSADALARDIQGWEIRAARRVNARLGRRGRVFGDRYHAEQLRTPTQVRNALCYVLQNARRHGVEPDRRFAGIDPYSSAWWFDGWADESWRDAVAPAGGPPPVAVARTWLLGRGWRRRGLIGLRERPPAGARA